MSLTSLMCCYRKYAAEIAHNVSSKKRKAIVERAAEVMALCALQSVFWQLFSCRRPLVILACMTHSHQVLPNDPVLFAAAACPRHKCRCQAQESGRRVDLHYYIAACVCKQDHSDLSAPFQSSAQRAPRIKLFAVFLHRAYSMWLASQVSLAGSSQIQQSLASGQFVGMLMPCVGFSSLMSVAQLSKAVSSDIANSKKQASLTRHQTRLAVQPSLGGPPCTSQATAILGL